MAVKQERLYLKADKNVEVKEAQVRLGEIAKMECTNEDALNRIKAQKVLTIRDTDQGRKVVSALKLIECIHQIYPDMEVENIGESDIIVTLEDHERKSRTYHTLKTGFIALLCFLGAAFSIMSFNNDVAVTRLFEQIYLQVTGVQSDGFTVLEVTYSIGMIIGILIFFNHIGKKKFSSDPTPMEVEMRTYEDEIQRTVVDASARKGNEVDVQ